MNYNNHQWRTFNMGGRIREQTRRERSKLVFERPVYGRSSNSSDNWNSGVPIWEPHPFYQVIRPVVRSMVSVTKPKIACPGLFKSLNSERDPAEVFRKPTVVAFSTLPLSTILHIDEDHEYYKFYDKFKKNVESVIKVDLSKQTEFAVIGPTGCSKYENQREHMIECEIWETSKKLSFSKFTTGKEIIAYLEKNAAQHIAAVEKFESFDYVTRTTSRPRATFLCSPESMVIAAERIDHEPGELSKIIQEDYNETWITKESFTFTSPGAHFSIEMKNDGKCDFVKHENAEEPTIETVTGYNGMSHYTETVEIELRYDSQQTNLNKAKVRLTHRHDMEKARIVLHENYVDVTEAKDTQYPTLVIKNMPNEINHNTILDWWLKRILSANNIEFKFAHFCTARVTPVKPQYQWNRPMLWVPEHIFAAALVEMAAQRPTRRLVENMFQPQDWEVLSKQQFTIEEQSISCKAQVKCLVARYSGKNVELGLRVADGCKRRVADRNFMRVTNTKFFPANLHFKFKKMMPMARKIRIAYDSVITDLDARMREHFVRFEEHDPVTFADERMEKHFARIVDVYSDDEDDGLLGIEGWPKEFVDEQFENLRTILQPVEFIITPEYEPLLYGVGEMFVKHLISKAGVQVVVDVDQFNSKITVFGENASNFVNKIKEFAVPNMMDVSIRIPLNPPFNNNIKQLFTKSICEEMKSEWGAEVHVDQKKNMVQFVGPLDAFRVFWKILNDINREIFKILSSHLPKLVSEPFCPICRWEIHPNSYRLDSCGHVYCRDCLNRMVRDSFEKPDCSPKCLYEGCNKTICPNDMKKIIVGGIERIKLLDSDKLKMMFEITVGRVIQQSRAKYSPCKTADCLGFLQPTGVNGETIKCLMCRNQFCAACADFLHTDIPSCEQNQEIRRNADLSLRVYVERMGPMKVKNCPGCSILIEMNDGCPHMACKMCKSDFCWICGYTDKDGEGVHIHITNNHPGESMQFLNMMDRLIGDARL